MNNGVEIHNAHIKRSINELSMQSNNVPILYLKPNLVTLNKLFEKTSNKRWNVFSIYDAYKNIIGEIYQKQTKFWGGYSFYEMVFNDVSYTYYEVGLGKKGTFICVYLKDVQIGLIERESVRYDNKDIYHVYLNNDEYIEIACILALHYDITHNANYGEVTYKKKDIQYFYSLNKELKSKYNESFKYSCI